MSRLFKLSQAFFIGVFLFASPSSVDLEGAITSVNNGGVIISPPSSVQDDPLGATGLVQQGFNEVQNFTLTDPLSVDLGATIPVGTVVNSHMLFLNPPGGGSTSHGPVTWTFDSIILGVMSDTAGLLEGASTPTLGNPGTTYPLPFAGRGLEPLDGFFFIGNSLTSVMTVPPGDPGDWVRVITLGVAVPEPSTYLLFAGFLGIAFVLKRRKAAAKAL